MTTRSALNRLPVSGTTAARRLPALAAGLGLLVAVLLGALALPAAAATSPTTTTPHGPTQGATAQPSNGSGSLTFAGLCVGGMVLVGGGVLFYTVRNRRTLLDDRDRR